MTRNARKKSSNAAKGKNEPLMGGRSRTINWEQVKAVYVQGYIDDAGVNVSYSLRELGRKFNLAPSTISRHAREGGWETLRQQTAKRKVEKVAHETEDLHIREMKAVIAEAESVGKSASNIHRLAAQRFGKMAEPEVKAILAGEDYKGEKVPISIREQLQAGKLAVDMKKLAFDLRYPDQQQPLAQAAVININLAEMDELDQRAAIRTGALSQLGRIKNQRLNSPSVEGDVDEDEEV